MNLKPYHSSCRSLLRCFALTALIGMTFLPGCYDPMESSTDLNFNAGWQFFRTAGQEVRPDRINAISDSLWDRVTLPHTAAIEPLVMTGDQWTGVCWYRKKFTIERKHHGQFIGLAFEAAMSDATIWINGTELTHHLGGYTPFFLDISDKIRFDTTNSLLIRLDNRENPRIPPGKPLKELDFYYYSGLYRNVRLIIRDRLHLTEPVETDSLQGGGTIFRTESLTQDGAVVTASVSVGNADQVTRRFSLEFVLRDPYGTVAAAGNSETVILRSLTSTRVFLRLGVGRPQPWSPDSPALYSLETRLTDHGRVLEKQIIRVGIRTLNISRDQGVLLNGKPVLIRGTNRHQEYPYIGYALSDNAQYRDAWKIRKAGFNFVRCSHYPQSPAFLNACDELGLMVMDPIPGWQYFGDSLFQALSLRNIREMCRRDRNHPSVILWEASLNETIMPVDFIRKAHETVHLELPYQDIYTCGWMDTVYDVFIPARQHAVPPDYWNRYAGPRPLFLAEYGSWEYYAQNAGFRQTEFLDLKPADRSSRQLRGYGERALLQQAVNFQEAYNDNLSGHAIGCANWVMFDYNRGYAPDIESSGIMDIFRLPKFSFWFYKSQGDKEPVCFIAHNHQPGSPPYVKVFSNGDSVALYRNGIFLATQKPDQNAQTSRLPHPPFTFRLNGYESGTLKAVSYRQDAPWAENSVTTPGNAVNLSLEADFSNCSLKADGADVIFIHAAITDVTGNVVHSSSIPVQFSVKGEATLIGMNPIPAEAGIASILLKAGLKPGKITLQAQAAGLNTATLQIRSDPMVDH